VSGTILAGFHFVFKNERFAQTLPGCLVFYADSTNRAMRIRRKAVQCKAQQ